MYNGFSGGIMDKKKGQHVVPTYATMRSAYFTHQRWNPVGQHCDIPSASASFRHHTVHVIWIILHGDVARNLGIFMQCGSASNSQSSLSCYSILYLMRIHLIHQNTGRTNKVDRLKFSETRTTVTIQCISQHMLTGYFGLLACDKSHFRLCQAYLSFSHFLIGVRQHDHKEGNTKWDWDVLWERFVPNTILWGIASNAALRSTR